MIVKKQIIKAIQKVVGDVDVHLETPEIASHGDFSSNIAMRMFAAKLKTKNLKRKTSVREKKSRKEKQILRQAQDDETDSKSSSDLSNAKTPRELAEQIVQMLKKDINLKKSVSKIEVAGGGFINFWLTRSHLVKETQGVLKRKGEYGKSNLLKGKKILLEHTSPNTIKTLHLGHVRNNVLGMSVHNILEFAGADVKLDAINNDRGIHVMKAVWAYLQFGHQGYSINKVSKPVDWKDRLKGWVSHEEDWRKPKELGMKGDKFADKYYVLGVQAESNERRGAEDFQGVKSQMQEMLQVWEAGDKEVRKVWKKLRDWTFEGFKVTYKKLGSRHDHQWFESEFYEHGKKMVEKGLERGVFKKLDDGAVLSQLTKFKLPDTIVLRADGTSMYHTQDLYLTQLKRKKFPSDLYIWDIGPEQTLYLKQLFAMCEQLGIGEVSDYMHMPYGFVFLRGKGKMSSRKGTVVSADFLMDEVVKKAREIIDRSETGEDLTKKEKEEISEAVGLGAIKYAFLKPARLTDIQFDIDESVSLQGNSGPYLQYTYARTQSVLRKFEALNSKHETNSKVQNSKISNVSDFDISILDLNKEELAVLRSFPHFSEVIIDASKNYSPNLLCNYLYDLAQKFNGFYNKHRILGEVNGEECIVNSGNNKDKGEVLPNTKHQTLNTSTFRLALTAATGQILKNGLELLGIEASERM